MARLLTAVAAAAMTLTGCSSVQLADGEGAGVPQERVYAPELLGEPAPGEGGMLFLRDTGFGGGGCTHDLYVDNRRTIGMRAGERAQLHLSPGIHLLRLVDATPICPGMTASQETTLESGVRQVYRVQISGSTGQLLLSRIQ